MLVSIIRLEWYGKCIQKLSDLQKKIAKSSKE